MTELYYKDALKRFKERRGKASEELRNHHREMTKLMKEVKAAIIEQGETTVPEIAEVINQPANKVFFAVNALKKWDNVVLTSKRGEYPKFALRGQEV